MPKRTKNSSQTRAEITADLQALEDAKTAWAKRDITSRIALLDQTRNCILDVAADWAALANTHKGIDPNTPMAGEEWFSGPYALLVACNELIDTLSQITGKAYLDGLAKTKLQNGQLKLRVMPRNWRDRIFSQAFAPMFGCKNRC